MIDKQKLIKEVNGIICNIEKILETYPAMQCYTSELMDNLDGVNLVIGKNKNSTLEFISLNARAAVNYSMQYIGEITIIGDDRYDDAGDQVTFKVKHMNKGTIKKTRMAINILKRLIEELEEDKDV